MTQTGQHTPGPWDFDGIGPSGEALFIVAPDQSGRWNDIYIAEIAVTDEEGRIAPTQAERDANARLIASAPEMLEALKTLISRAHDLMAAIDGVTDQFDPEIQALSKAASATDKLVVRIEGGAS